MNLKILILTGFSFLLVFTGCEKEADPVYSMPLAYLPAYPGSFWDYTNGIRVKTEPFYSQHSYQLAPTSSDKSDLTFVPVYDGKYLYGYSFWQNVPLYPLKKLLSEKLADEWVVNEQNNVKIYRKNIRILDSLVVKFPPFNEQSDSVFRSVIVIVEYIDSLGATRWNTKEYYAKNVGLIRTETNNPFDTLSPIVVSTIQNYYINK